MSERSLFQRLLNAKSALNATIEKILDLNRRLKSLSWGKKSPENTAIKQELKLLNKVADQQAKIVQMYEKRLNKRFGN
jgi:hypothetical protein